MTEKAFKSLKRRSNHRKSVQIAKKNIGNSQDQQNYRTTAKTAQTAHCTTFTIQHITRTDRFSVLSREFGFYRMPKTSIVIVSINRISFCVESLYVDCSIRQNVYLMNY